MQRPGRRGHSSCSDPLVRPPVRTAARHPRRSPMIPQAKIQRRGAVAGLAMSLIPALLVVAACSTNPATGKRQVALISEQQEIAMGLEADQQIQQQLGLYPDQDLQAYVNRVGQKLAASSERPNLPWTFRVVD